MTKTQIETIVSYIEDIEFCKYQCSETEFNQSVSELKDFISKITPRQKFYRRKFILESNDQSDENPIKFIEVKYELPTTIDELIIDLSKKYPHHSIKPF